MSMTIWIVTYGDGFEFSGQFIAAFSDSKGAEDYCSLLNQSRKSEYGGFDTQEVTLDEVDEL